MKNKKGFTMMELAISIAVSAILMLILAGVFAISKQNMTSASTSANRLNEFYKIEKAINNWISMFSNTDYELMYCIDNDDLAGSVFYKHDGSGSENADMDEGHIKVYKYILFGNTKNNSFKYYLYYDESKKELTIQTPTETQSISLSMVSNISFSQQGNLIKATMTYEKTNKFGYYTLLFNYKI